jgi:hypothetical protein
MEEDAGSSVGIHSLWPRKRRLSERDAAFGLKTSVGLGGYLGVMGSRRDVVTAVWRTGLDGEWYKVSMVMVALPFAVKSGFILHSSLTSFFFYPGYSPDIL